MISVPDSLLTANWPALLHEVGAVRLREIVLDNGVLLATGNQLGRVSKQAISRHPELNEADGVQRACCRPSSAG